MNKKFNNARYITRGIQCDIPIEIQTLLWDCIDSLQKEKELDYLQVFELTKERVNGILLQKIAHEQELPVYNKTYRLSREEIVQAKIFVIDDGDHSTMLLAEEY